MLKKNRAFHTRTSPPRLSNLVPQIHIMLPLSPYHAAFAVTSSYWIRLNVAAPEARAATTSNLAALQGGAAVPNDLVTARRTQRGLVAERRRVVVARAPVVTTRRQTASSKAVKTVSSKAPKTVARRPPSTANGAKPQKSTVSNRRGTQQGRPVPAKKTQKPERPSGPSRFYFNVTGYPFPLGPFFSRKTIRKVVS